MQAIDGVFADVRDAAGCAVELLGYKVELTQSGQSYATTFPWPSSTSYTRRLSPWATGPIVAACASALPPSAPPSPNRPPPTPPNAPGATMIATVEFTLHQLHYARARALLTGADAVAKLSTSLHHALRRAHIWSMVITQAGASNGVFTPWTVTCVVPAGEEALLKAEVLDAIFIPHVNQQWEFAGHSLFSLVLNITLPLSV